MLPSIEAVEQALLVSNFEAIHADESGPMEVRLMVVRPSVSSAPHRMEQNRDWYVVAGDAYHDVPILGYTGLAHIPVSEDPWPSRALAKLLLDQIKRQIAREGTRTRHAR